MTPAISRAQVSVVIPVRDGAAYIAEAIETVHAQSHPACEIVVVDDGSRDASAAIAAAMAGVSVIATAHGGQAQARNIGAQRARGSHIAFLDADDLWAPGKLAAQVAAFDSDPGVEAVFAHAIEFKKRDASGAPIPVGAAVPAYLPSAMMIRGESFERTGGFRRAGEVAEVVEWFARASDLGLRTRVLDEVLMMRRLHAGNIGRTADDPRRDYLRALREAIQRRRDGAPVLGGD